MCNVSVGNFSKTWWYLIIARGFSSSISTFDERERLQFTDRHCIKNLSLLLTFICFSFILTFYSHYAVLLCYHVGWHIFLVLLVSYYKSYQTFSILNNISKKIFAGVNFIFFKQNFINDQGYALNIKWSYKNININDLRQNKIGNEIIKWKMNKMKYLWKEKWFYMLKLK